MKNNLGTFLGLSRWGVGAVALALCAFAPSSRADVIVNNVGASGTTGQAAIGDLSPDSTALAQVFTMSGSSADLSSVTLEVIGSGSAEVWLYGTSGGVPDNTVGTPVDLGSVTQGANSLSVSAGHTLVASTAYAIVLSLSSSTLNWEYVNSQGTVAPGASWGDQFSGSGNAAGWTDTSIFSPGNFYEMNVQVVPEVPMTGLVMGFGALAIGLGYTLRRKLQPAV